MLVFCESVTFYRRKPKPSYEGQAYSWGFSLSCALVLLFLGAGWCYMNLVRDKKEEQKEREFSRKTSWRK